MFRQRKSKVEGDEETQTTMTDKRRMFAAPALTMGQTLAIGFLWLASIVVAVHMAKTELHMAAVHRSGGLNGQENSQGPSTHTLSALSGTAAGVPSGSGECTEDMARRQGEYAPVARVRGCPSEDDAWLRFTQLHLPHAKVFIDIGSNKGYTAARFFELWNPEFGVDSGTLHKALRATTKEKDLIECGACNDCMEVGVSLMPVLPRFCGRAAEATSDPNMAHSLSKAVSAMCEEHAERFEPIRVFSFDGNPVMVNGVSKARDLLASSDIGVSTLSGVQGIVEKRLPFKPKQRFLKAKWSIELAAFSDVYEPGKTVEFVLGIGEKGHLVVGEGADPKADESSEKRAIVPILTVDQLAERDALSHIDILKIDTEGHDPNVLRGAKKTIGSHAVTLVIFEYNAVWEQNEKLESVVHNIFEVNGYACYLEGKNLLLKLTHGCWSPRLEMRKWSNVWCLSLRRADGVSLSTVFDSYSVAFL